MWCMLCSVMLWIHYFERWKLFAVQPSPANKVPKKLLCRSGDLSSKSKETTCEMNEKKDILPLKNSSNVSHPNFVPTLSILNTWLAASVGEENCFASLLFLTSLIISSSLLVFVTSTMIKDINNNFFNENMILKLQLWLNANWMISNT